MWIDERDTEWCMVYVEHIQRSLTRPEFTALWNVYARVVTGLDNGEAIGDEETEGN